MVLFGSSLTDPSCKDYGMTYEEYLDTTEAMFWLKAGSWPSFLAFCVNLWLFLGCCETPEQAAGKKFLLRGTVGKLLMGSLGVWQLFNITNIAEPLLKHILSSFGCSNQTSCIVIQWLYLCGLNGAPYFFAMLCWHLWKISRSPFHSREKTVQYVLTVMVLMLVTTWLISAHVPDEDLEFFLQDKYVHPGCPCPRSFLNSWASLQTSRVFYFIGTMFIILVFSYSPLWSSFTSKQRTTMNMLGSVLTFEAVWTFLMPNLIMFTKNYLGGDTEAERDEFRKFSYIVECIMFGAGSFIISAGWGFTVVYVERKADKAEKETEFSSALRQQIVNRISDGIKEGVRMFERDPSGDGVTNKDFDMYSLEIETEDASPCAEKYESCVCRLWQRVFGLLKPDIKVQAYAPRPFHILRKQVFRLSEFRASFDLPFKGGNFTEGKSGAFMYFTSDGEYIVKTATKEEFNTLKKIMPSYFDHMSKNPDSLINPLLGAYQLSLNNQHVRVIIIQSVFDRNLIKQGKSIDQRFDLKGSWVGRTSKKPKKVLPWARKYSSRMHFQDDEVRKDLDIPGPLLLSPHKKRLFGEALTKDSEWLAEHHIMDYSLLVGVHKEAKEIPAIDGEARHNVAPAVVMWGPTLYHLGIIDILQEFSLRKQLEYVLRVYVLFQGHGVSCVPPKLYAERFRNNIVNPLILQDQETNRVLERMDSSSTRSDLPPGDRGGSLKTPLLGSGSSDPVASSQPLMADDLM